MKNIILTLIISLFFLSSCKKEELIDPTETWWIGEYYNNDIPLPFDSIWFTMEEHVGYMTLVDFRHYRIKEIRRDSILLSNYSLWVGDNWNDTIRVQNPDVWFTRQYKLGGQQFRKR